MTSVRVSCLKIKISHILSLIDTEAQDPHSSGCSLLLDPDAACNRQGIRKIVNLKALENVDIIPHASRLSFSILATVDGKKIDSKQVCISAAAKHLLESLRAVCFSLSMQFNLDASFCIRTQAYLVFMTFLIFLSSTILLLVRFLLAFIISPMYHKHHRCIGIVLFTSSHPLTEPSTSLGASLVSLKLVYAWVNTSKKEQFFEKEDLPVPFSYSPNPITSSRVAPFLLLLNQVVHRLFAHHIIRYFYRTFPEPTENSHLQTIPSYLWTLFSLHTCGAATLPVFVKVSLLDNQTV